MSKQPDRWHEILIREYNTTDDKEYAEKLFDLIADRPLGWKASFGLIFVVALFTIAGVPWVMAVSEGDPAAGQAVMEWISAVLLAGFGLSYAVTRLPARVLERPRDDMGGDSVLYGYRPYPFEVEKSLRQICARKPAARKEWEEAFLRLEEKKEQHLPLESLLADLRSRDWRNRFAARHALVAMGGEAISPLLSLSKARKRLPARRIGGVNLPMFLEPSSLWETALLMIDSIAQDTSRRLGGKASLLLCPSCLIRCFAHEVRLPWGSYLTYYGCRSCRQSREFVEWDVVAVLNAGMSQEQTMDNDVLRVNWLQRRSLFDFDWVEIIRATDEEVERFAVQVGNDMDDWRRSRYKKMACAIASDCSLSENTMRILRDIFGQVAVMQDTGKDLSQT